MENLVGCVVLIAAGGAVQVFRGAMECERNGFRLVHRVPAEERYFFGGYFRDAVRVKDEKEVRAPVAVDGGKEILAGSRAEDVFEQAQFEIAVEPMKVERASRTHHRALGVMAQKELEFLRGFCVGAVGLARAG